MWGVSEGPCVELRQKPFHVKIVYLCVNSMYMLNLKEELGALDFQVTIWTFGIRC